MVLEADSRTNLSITVANSYYSPYLRNVHNLKIDLVSIRVSHYMRLTPALILEMRRIEPPPLGIICFAASRHV